MFNFWKKTKIEKNKFVFTTNNIRRSTGNGDRISASSGYQSDFIPSDYITLESSVQGVLSNAPYNNSNVNSLTPVSKDERKEVQPKEVFDEIKKEEVEISFDNLDEKIFGVEERLKILSDHLDESHLMDEHRALFYLKNRKKYLQTRTKNPIDWAMTSREAVNDLCKRYKLTTVPLKQYYTLVPKDGLKELDRYTKAYKGITGDSPIFELIIKDIAVIQVEKANEIRKKDRDPILLANSPLGNHLFILGAWDEEVAIVDEIIYQGK